MGRLRHLLVGVGLVSAVFLTGSNVDYFEEQLPSTMIPIYARTMVDRRAHELVFDRMFYRSAITNELRSRLVERYQVLEGGKKIKLVLRSGVKWHDGKDLTPDDVCFTVDALLNEKNPSNDAKDYREALAGCESQPKENSAVIAFRKIYHNPRERVAFHVLPKHKFDSSQISPDDDFALRPIGTGPVKGSKGRREVSFSSVPNAHRRANVAQLQLKEGGDPFVQVRTLINAGVQGVIAVAPPLRPEVAASDDVALKSYDLRSWWFIAVNTASGALKHQKVRQALDLTIDRSELRELTIGVDKDDPNPPCEFISGPFVQSSPYYNRQVKVAERSDRARAGTLMEQAGATKAAGRWTMDGAPVNLRIGMNAPLDTEARDLLNQIGNQLQAGGFDRQVYRVTADDWNRKAVAGQLKDFDLLIGKWSFGMVEYVNPLFHSRKGGKGSMNIFNYSNPEVDKILTRFDAARTDTEARDAYHDLHSLLAKDLPYIFLWKLDTKSAWRNEVRNNTIAPYYYFTEFDGWTIQ
ncbi:MAG: ABC transporter substrate-binding protein [Deltaproteobacteria bacterium]|nr:MAG: ABC transporter substrate-binding protein [Deltaproteobacteria bacterium]